MKKSILLATAILTFGAIGSSQAKRIPGAVVEQILVEVENKTSQEQKVEIILSRFFGARYPELKSLGEMTIPKQSLKTPKKGSMMMGAYLQPGKATKRFPLPQEDIKRMQGAAQNGAYVKAKIGSPVMRMPGRLGASSYTVIFKINGKELKQNLKSGIFDITIEKDVTKVEQAMA